MNDLIILATSDPQAGKIIGSAVLGPLLALAYVLYQNKKGEE